MQTTTSSPETRGSAARSILVVDDSEDQRLLLATLLEAAGFTTTTVESAAAAIEALSKSSFDLVLADVLMPETSGLDLCRQVRREHPTLPVIVITASADERDVERSFEAGASDFVPKPVRRRELLSRVAKVLRSSARDRAMRQKVGEFEGEMRTAAEVQRAFLPPSGMRLGDLQFEYVYAPHRQLGGDLFHYGPLGGHQATGRSYVYIGDICGHGAQAALLMSAVRATIAAVLSSEDAATASPWQILNRVNGHAREYLGENYVTLLFGIHDARTGQLCLLSAGHPAPCRIRGKATSFLATEGGMPIGWMPGEPYAASDQVTVNLSPGDSLLLFTDGVLEVEGPGGAFGEAGLSRCLGVALSSIGAADDALGAADDGRNLCRVTREAMEAEGFGAHQDDVTLLAIRREPAVTAANWALDVRPSTSLAAALQVAGALPSLEEPLRPMAGLALHELFINALRHGFAKVGRREARIGVRAESDPERLVVVVEDEGPAWTLPAPTRVDEVSELSEGGRGLALVRCVFPEIALQRRGRHNVLRLERMVKSA